MSRLGLGEPSGQPVPGQAIQPARPGGRVDVPVATAYRLVADARLCPGQFRPDLPERQGAPAAGAAWRPRTSGRCWTTSRPGSRRSCIPRRASRWSSTCTSGTSCTMARTRIAPDLTVVLTDWRYRTIGLHDFTTHRVISPAFGPTGDHRMEGILVASGRRSAPGPTPRRRAARHRPDRAAPAGGPGPRRHGRPRPRRDPRPGALAGRPARPRLGDGPGRRTRARRAAHAGDSYTAEEDAEIQRRLEDLGYLSSPVHPPFASRSVLSEHRPASDPRDVVNRANRNEASHARRVGVSLHVDSPVPGLAERSDNCLMGPRGHLSYLSGASGCGPKTMRPHRRGVRSDHADLVDPQPGTPDHGASPDDVSPAVDPRDRDVACAGKPLRRGLPPEAGTDPHRGDGPVGEFVFGQAALVQILLTIWLVPTCVAGVIAEKERRSLTHLLTTRLTAQSSSWASSRRGWSSTRRAWRRACRS